MTSERAKYLWNSGTYIPNSGIYIPNSGTYIPNSGTYKLNSGIYIPNSGTYIPNSSTYIPNSGTYIPNSSTYIPNSGTYIPNYKASCLWKLHSKDKNTVPQSTNAEWQQNVNNWAHSSPCKWLYFFSQSSGLNSEAALLPSSLRSLAIGWSPGIELWWWRDFSAPIQMSPGTHPSYTKGTVSFPGIKQMGCGINHSCPLQHPLCTFIQIMGWTSFLPLHLF